MTAAKQSLTNSITLWSGTTSSLSRFVLYRLDCLPAITSFQGSKSRAHFSDISKYAFLLVCFLEMSVGGRLLDSVDRATILHFSSTSFRRRYFLSYPAFAIFLVSFLKVVATCGIKSLQSNKTSIISFTCQSDDVASSIFHRRQFSNSDGI